MSLNSFVLYLSLVLLSVNISWAQSSNDGTQFVIEGLNNSPTPETTSPAQAQDSQPVWPNQNTGVQFTIEGLDNSPRQETSEQQATQNTPSWQDIQRRSEPVVQELPQTDEPQIETSTSETEDANQNPAPGASNDVLQVAQSLSPINFTCERTNANDVRSKLRCLTCNCFHEARGQTSADREAVALTVQNRVNASSSGRRWDRRPSSVCGVVYQRYQYSWANNSRKRNRRLSSFDRGTPTVTRRNAEACLEVSVNALNDYYPNLRAYLSSPQFRSQNPGVNAREAMVGEHYYNSCIANPAWARRCINRRSFRFGRGTSGQCGHRICIMANSTQYEQRPINETNSTPGRVYLSAPGNNQGSQ